MWRREKVKVKEAKEAETSEKFQAKGNQYRTTDQRSDVGRKF